MRTPNWKPPKDHRMEMDKRRSQRMKGGGKISIRNKKDIDLGSFMMDHLDKSINEFKLVLDEENKMLILTSDEKKEEMKEDEEA